MTPDRKGQASSKLGRLKSVSNSLSHSLVVYVTTNAMHVFAFGLTAKLSPKA
jgi:hypothetical protein